MSTIDKFNARYKNRKTKEETPQSSSQPASNKTDKDFEKIKKELQNFGFSIKDEAALKNELKGLATSNGIPMALMGALKDKGIIVSAENAHEPDKSETPKKTPTIISISEEVETPDQAQTPQEKRAETENRIKELLAKRERTEKVIPLEKTIALEKFPESIETWCAKNVNKKDNRPKRKTNISKQTTNEINIEVTPLSPIAKKQGDLGAVYTVKKTPNPKKLDVTLKSQEQGKPLNYDYFYALVKAAKDSGADTIEFNNIRTPEFRDKLLAAALQFKMKIKNPPGIINLEAEHLQSIPPGCRQYLEKHNTALKKVMEEKRKALEERKQQSAALQRAEDRPLSEQKRIEASREEEKLKRAEKFLNDIPKENASKGKPNTGRKNSGKNFKRPSRER